FMRRVTAEADIVLPATPGNYGVGFIYLPQLQAIRQAVETLIEKVIVDEGQKFLGWRDVPIDTEHCGEGARMTMPVFRQCFIAAGGECVDDSETFERKLYLIRRVIDRRVRAEHKLDRS